MTVWGMFTCKVAAFTTVFACYPHWGGYDQRALDVTLTPKTGYTQIVVDGRGDLPLDDQQIVFKADAGEPELFMDASADATWTKEDKTFTRFWPGRPENGTTFQETYYKLRLTRPIKYQDRLTFNIRSGALSVPAAPTQLKAVAP